MAFPIHHLPVVQNWDCHVCGSCCKEYLVTVTPEEQQRIEAQGWDIDKDLDGRAPFRTTMGPPWSRRTVLNHRPDGSCVFLSEDGRFCRIHERFGYQTKPLACRLYPFVLVPAGDHWRVGLRYACPSAAMNKGRPLPEHTPALQEFAARLAQEVGLQPQPDGSMNPPPPLVGGQVVSWPDVYRIVEVLLRLLRNRRDPLERRWRKCLALAAQMRHARLKGIEGSRLQELLDLLVAAADQDTPADPMQVPAPSWVGRILFRQAAALFTRKDQGPNQGPARRSRLALLRAAWEFTRGTGPIPRMHRGLPETTFEQVEAPRGPVPADAEEILERYYTMKVGSLQFCIVSFRLPLWEGLEMLALTFPIILWVARMFQDRSRTEAILQALTVVDDHVGFNRVLRTLRQRTAFQILARRGELSRLIAWYSR
jgi:lysine-N-methylase